MNITQIAFIFAKAQFADKYGAVEPIITEKRVLKLVKARHPLLDTETVVPITVSLGEEFDTLVITGPNTGGKTVTLKTLGLFALMAQSGLHLPAESAECGVFEEILADIGDEQSIEQSLSTFSSHMVNIIKILKKVSRESLVLFDELGAGTDPIEGAAIAISVLEEIRSYKGALCAATTHYSELKEYAANNEGVTNAGCEFDIETLKRSIPFFRSDYQCNFNENPEVLQTHNANISAYLPYNGCTSKTKNDTYAIRSSYSSSWGGAFYNAIFQSMNEEDFKWAKQITDEYRKIRKYFSMDFYNHGSNVFDSTAWAIWQYHDNEAQSGIVMAFRRKNSPFDNVEIQLKSTVENQEYLFNDLNTGNTFIGSNAIKIHLPQKQSSVIMEYKLK